MYADNDNLVEEIVNDNFYDIRSDGTIWARKPKSGPMARGKIYPLRQVDHNREGYRLVRYKDKYLKCHRIVYCKFVGELEYDLDINHKDGNKSNNNISNLELVTHKVNVQHSRDTGLNPRLPIKLTESKVLEIRQLGKLGFSSRVVAEKYGLVHTTVQRIWRGEYWNHI
jgi:hypothetical protein